ncbi:unnamed protein product, partial [Oppiella nova]
MKFLKELTKQLRVLSLLRPRNRFNDRIPDSVLLLIVSKLNVNERIKLQLVCKKWEQIIQLSLERQPVLMISDERYFPLRQCLMESRLSAKHSKQFVIIADNERFITENVLQIFRNVSTICWTTKCLETEFRAMIDTIGKHCNHMSLISVCLFDISTYESTKIINMDSNEKALQLLLNKCQNLQNSSLLYKEYHSSHTSSVLFEGYAIENSNTSSTDASIIHPSPTFPPLLGRMAGQTDARP